MAFQIICESPGNLAVVGLLPAVCMFQWIIGSFEKFVAFGCRCEFEKVLHVCAGGMMLRRINCHF